MFRLGKRSVTVGLTMLSLGILVTGCGSSQSSDTGVTLTYWTQYTSTDPENKWIQAAVNEFEKQHPGDKVDVVRQPSNDQFFTLFQSASLARKGPDIVDLWTGLYGLRYKQFLVPLNNYLTAAQKSETMGLSAGADGFNAQNNIYGIVSELQSYMGFYNKKLFVQAGISTLPTTYAQFLKDCAALKQHGITPIASGENYEGQFQPQNLFTYYLMNELTADQINDLRTGKIQWTDSRIVRALTDMVATYKDGYTNPDILTNQDPMQLFATGKTAMILNDGSWDMPLYSKSLGDNVGIFYVPQDPSAPSAGDIVAYPGTMTSVTNYSKHQALAIDFLKDALNVQVADAMAESGLIPASKSVPTSQFVSSLQQQLYQLAVSKTAANQTWPMFDNEIQPTVVSAMIKEVGLAVTQKETPINALQAIQQTWNSLPSDQKQ